MTRVGAGYTLQFHGEEYEAIKKATRENGSQNLPDRQSVADHHIQNHLESLIEDYLKRGGFYDDPDDQLPDEINTQDLSDEMKQQLVEDMNE